MDEALSEAKKGVEDGEIPVGCVIVKDGKIIARAHNTVEKNSCPINHAEINAINTACNYLGEKFLTDCEMYVTLEPCAMCSGAILNSRIGKLYYGIEEPKTGCCGSNYNLISDTRFNFTVEYKNENDEKCREILREFFERRRKEC